MKHQIPWNDYLDRVFGCWMGKCVAGTIGAPYEGMKQLMEMQYTPAMTAAMLPNDDLDLQVLWLEVLEQKGTAFTSEDLANIFAGKCPYAPGEYAVFKKNYRRGIHPPYSGRFNNSYYLEGMGCPIRSEIWACVAPGDPELAAALAAKDGILDHEGNSVYAEQFLAATEALAFVESDVNACMDRALALVPQESRFARMVRDTRRWCGACGDWREARMRLLAEYGHPDCTNMFQNMGVILIALHYGKGDFMETTMIALNGGFDTDCTCATVGALLGTRCGAKTLQEKHGFKDEGFKLSVNTTRRSDRVADLAEDTCRMGLVFGALNSAVEITGGPEAPRIEVKPPAPLQVRAEYAEMPAIGLGDTRHVDIVFSTEEAKPGHVRAEVIVPTGWQVTPRVLEADLEEKHATCRATIFVPEGLTVLEEINKLRIQARLDASGAAVEHEFGLAGAAVWTMVGPFWENVVTVPPLGPGDTYWAHVTAGVQGEAAVIDRVRDYHLNAVASLEREYVTHDQMAALAQGEKVPGVLSRTVNLYEDRFRLEGLTGWQGPCAVYLARRLLSPADRTVFLQLGHSGPFRLWVNGTVVSEKYGCGWWTNENTHVPGVALKKGENLLVWKVVRPGEASAFSMVFSETISCSNHYDDFASANPHTA